MERPPFTPEQITALPGSAATAVAWRAKGQLHISLVVKATFAFAPDAAMPRTEPQEIVRAEVHHGNNPGRSIRLTSDLAPYLGRADVLFTGNASAPPGGPVCSLPVRLAVFAGQRAVLDKRLIVEDPKGFERMPIVYERALRGPDDKENPLGVAASTGEANVRDPGQRDRPAGFGPIGRSWPARKRLLGPVSRAALDGPIAEIPEGFDWSYFQAAPPDQRIDFLSGDEWIILEGLHPPQPRFRTRLPGARASARIHGLSAFGVPEGQGLDLHADTLRIDGDAQRCTVVWRRSFPIPSQAALAAVRVVAGVSIGNETLSWVEPRMEPRLAVGVDLPSDSNQQPTSGAETLSITTDVDIVEAQKTLPFTDGVVSGAMTLAISPNDTNVAQPTPALPFREGPSALAQPEVRSSVTAAEHPFTGTLDIVPPPEIPAVFVQGLLQSPIDPKELSPWAKLQPPEPEVPSAARLFHDLRRKPFVEDEPPPMDAPAEQPGAVTLERCAAIAAELGERRGARAKVLSAHGLTERRWAEAEAKWSRMIARELDRGERATRDAYDDAFVAAWEKVHGAIGAAHYTRLNEAEPGELEDLLEGLKIQRTVWMRLRRVWRRRLEREPDLATSAAGKPSPWPIPT